MVALSALLKIHIFNDLKDFVYFDAVNLDHVSNFAQKLHLNNILEVLQAAISNVQHSCGCHGDSQNDTHPHFSAVRILLEIDETIYQLALIGYSRKAIQDYHDQQNQPMAIWVQNIKSASRLVWVDL
jgi:hypothetical protein